jgi:uncharacterized protein (DUF111 family)
MKYYASYFGDISIKVNKIQKLGINSTYVNIKCHDKSSITYMALLERLNTIEHQLVTADILNFAKKGFQSTGRN